MELRVTDKAEIIKDGDGKPRLTRDGYLLVQCRVSRCGIQQYLGSELGMDQDVVNVYRPESSVFDTDSLASFAFKPITIDHPNQPVNSSNYGKLAVGHIGGEISTDSNKFVTVPMMLTDADVIRDIQENGSELSAGYSMRLEVKEGVTDSGESYSAIQHDIRANHVACVPKGRAGPACSISVGDSWPTDSTYDYKPRRTPARKSKTQNRNPVMDVRTIIVDGLSVDTTDAGAQAIEKLQGEITKLNDAATTASETHTAAIDTLKDDHKTAISAKDEEIGELKGKVKGLEDAAMTPEKLDALVADRSVLIGKAAQICKDADFTGKTDAEVMRSCVEAHYGKDAVSADESDDVVRGMFKGIKVGKDSFRDALINRQTSGSTNSVDYSTMSQVSDSQAAYEHSLSNGGVLPKQQH